MRLICVDCSLVLLLKLIELAPLIRESEGVLHNYGTIPHTRGTLRHAGVRHGLLLYREPTDRLRLTVATGFEEAGAPLLLVSL